MSINSCRCHQMSWNVTPKSRKTQCWFVHMISFKMERAFIETVCSMLNQSQTKQLHVHVGFLH